ncbi:MAG: hypothetical protein LYZ69_05665 [Nitrososphaerales archaeon]|nr:hypothetical protein [Nitrososphaerales archaeon]
MRPALGVVLELVALTAVVGFVGSFPVEGMVGVILLLLAQAATTFLIHCPAHFVVGSLLGMKFRRISLGQTTIMSALPSSLKPLGRLLPIPYLSVNRVSIKRASPRRLKVMYLSGVVASVGSGLAFAAFVTLKGNSLASIVTWIFAIAYLSSDAVGSPKTGDVMRARRVQSSAA